MSLSLSCPCGARFEVEETLAGQAVSCPECQQPVAAAAGHPRPVRTSGFALASAVLALLLGFTGVGAALAALLGVVALLVIARGGGRVKGVGYAVFGLAWGAACTGLFVFALARGAIGDISEGIHEQLMSGQVDRSGPLEVRRPDKGFAITRPSAKWGVAKPKLVEELGAHKDLILCHPGKDTWLAVETVAGGGDVEILADNYVSQRFQNDPFDFTQPAGRRALRPHFSNARALHKKVLEPKDGAQRAEVLADVKLDDVGLRYLVHIVVPDHGRKVYYVEGWASQKRFPAMEEEIRRALNSFRILDE